MARERTYFKQISLFRARYIYVQTGYRCLLPASCQRYNVVYTYTYVADAPSRRACSLRRGLGVPFFSSFPFFFLFLFLFSGVPNLKGLKRFPWGWTAGVNRIHHRSSNADRPAYTFHFCPACHPFRFLLRRGSRDVRIPRRKRTNYKISPITNEIGDWIRVHRVVRLGGTSWVSFRTVTMKIIYFIERPISGKNIFFQSLFPRSFIYSTIHFFFSLYRVAGKKDTFTRVKRHDLEEFKFYVHSHLNIRVILIK